MSSDIGEFRLIGGVILGIKRVEDGVARFGTFDDDRMRSTVIHIAVARQGHGKVGGHNERANRIGRRSNIVAVGVAFDGISNFHIVVANIRGGECAERFHCNRSQIVGSNDVNRAACNFGIGIAVIILVGNRRPADGKLARGDFEGRATSPLGGVHTGDGNQNIVRADVDKLRHLGVSLTIVGVGDDIARLNTGQDKSVLLTVVGDGSAGE